MLTNNTKNVELSLVHIPIRLYDFYVKPLIQLLLPEEGNFRDVLFVNISINQIEASVVLPKELAERYFQPLASSNGSLQGQDQLEDQSAIIAPDDYVLMFVTGSESQPSQRVIDLTTPLALAGISIFFITTYFSDYIICPRRSRLAVIAALEARGFELTHDHSDQNSNYAHRPATSSSSDSSIHNLAPGTPPPATLSELQIRTFKTLKKRQVTPIVNRDIRLVHCAGQEGPSHNQQALQNALLKCVLSKPKFFSLTLAEGESPSILLEKNLLPQFSTQQRESSSPQRSNKRDSMQQSLLLGTNSEVLIPIVLDLRTLPLESTGIVCGVAGRLVGATRGQLIGPVEMSYLSTARAGCVIVMEDDLERSLKVLEMDPNESPS